MAAEKRAEALSDFQKSLAIIQQLVDGDKGNAQWQGDLRSLVNKIGSLAYGLVFSRNFPTALAAADQAIALAPDKAWLHGNRAYVLMFLGRVDEARAIYLKFRGTPNVQGDKSWEVVT